MVENRWTRFKRWISEPMVVVSSACLNIGQCWGEAKYSNETDAIVTAFIRVVLFVLLVYVASCIVSLASFIHCEFAAPRTDTRGERE